MTETTHATDGIELGDIARDTIGGSLGLVVAHGTHISGCDRFALRPLATERFEEETFFFPSELDVVEDAAEAIDEADVPIDPPTDIDPVTETDLELGNVVEDDITGTEGYVTTITYRLFNCPRVALTPTSGDTDREWFDVPRVEHVCDGVAEDYQDLTESTTETETGPDGTDLCEKSSGLR